MLWFKDRSSKRQGARRHASRRIAPQLSQLESRQMLTVTYHGGAVLANVEAESLFLGSAWNSDSNLKGQTTHLNNFLNDVVNSPYMDAMNREGYGVNRGSFTPGPIDLANLDPQYYLDDSTIQSAVQSEINTGWLQAPDSNRLYVVFVEPGIAIRQSNGDTSLSTFLGYHTAFAGQDASGNSASIRYAVIAYPGAATNGGSANGMSTMDSLTAVTSHELAEAVTDPDVNYRNLGWYDDANGEVGDITAGQSAAYTRLSDGCAVQMIADRSDRILQLSQPATSPAYLVVFGNGALYQYDSAGAHYLAGGVRSATLNFTRSGSPVYDVVYTNGALYQYDASGSHYLCGGVESASLTYTASGSPVYEVAFANGALYQYDASGGHYLTGGVRQAGIYFI